MQWNAKCMVNRERSQSKPRWETSKADVDLFQNKISEFFIICFKNVGAKNSALFISYKVIYTNIHFFLKRFQSVSKFAFSFLVQAEGTSLPTPWVLFCMNFFWDIFPCSFILFFPHHHPPPSPLITFQVVRPLIIYWSILSRIKPFLFAFFFSRGTIFL